MEKVTKNTQDEPPVSGAGATGMVIDLARGLEIKDVEEAYKSLTAALEKGVALTIDLAHVGAIDTAGVQLLLGLQLEAAKRGTPLRFAGESAVFNKALMVLGLQESFNPAGSRG